MKTYKCNDCGTSWQIEGTTREGQDVPAVDISWCPVCESELEHTGEATSEPAEPPPDKAA
jgi:hypothetical protein